MSLLEGEMCLLQKQSDESSVLIFILWGGNWSNQYPIIIEKCIISIAVI